MMIKLWYIILLLCFRNVLIAQDLPSYTVDLDTEMHYKVNATNWQNRGIQEFKNDLQILLGESDFKNLVYIRKAFSVFYIIKFSADGKSELEIVGSSFERNDAIQQILVKKLRKIIHNFKSARYKGNVIPKTYLISFCILLNNNTITVNNIFFEPTVSFDTATTECFTVYSKAKENFLNENIFTAAEVGPYYKEDIQFLCFKINKILLAKYDKNSFSKFGVDSVEIPFIIEKTRKLGIMDISFGRNSLEDEILDCMMKTSCGWLPAMFSGRPVNFGLKLKFIYEYQIDAITKETKLIWLHKVETIRAKSSDFDSLEK